MYPEPELARLASKKIALQRHIAVHRTQCVEAMSRAIQPVEWIDRAVSFWHRLSPFAQFAAVPLGILVKRTVFSRIKILGPLTRWGPLVVSAWRTLSSARKPHHAK